MASGAATASELVAFKGRDVISRVGGHAVEGMWTSACCTYGGLRLRGHKEPARSSHEIIDLSTPWAAYTCSLAGLELKKAMAGDAQGAVDAVVWPATYMATVAVRSSRESRCCPRCWLRRRVPRGGVQQGMQCECLHGCRCGVFSFHVHTIPFMFGSD